MTTIASKIPWLTAQSKSQLHWGSVFAFGMILFLSYRWPPFIFIGMAAFLLITSFHMIWKMLIFIALISIVLAVLPFLAPLAVIVMIVLFIMRINYVIENWRPVAMGLVFYGSSIPLFASFQTYYLHAYGHPFIISIVGALLLHIVLSWLLSHGYSTKTALGIMGSVPIVILAFILPFLKLHVPAPDVFFEPSPAPGGHVLGSEPVTFQTEVKPVTMSHPIGESTHVMKSYESKPLVLSEKVGTNVFDGHSLTEQPINSDLFKHSAIMHPVFNSFMTDVSDHPFTIKEGSVHLQSNFQGGHNYLQNGQTLWTSQLNQFGGQDVYDQYGQKFVSSQPNQFGGENVMDAQNRVLMTTQANPLGGYNLFDQHNSKIGYTSTDVTGATVLYNNQNVQIGTLQNDILNIKKS